MTLFLRWFGAAAMAMAALALAACDSSGESTPTATAGGGSAALDPCLLGTWKSTGITGTLTIGGAAVTLRGGAGELLSITSDAVVRTDDSAIAPVQGTAPDGTVYRLVQSGSAEGRIASGGGRIAVNLAQPTSLTVTLYRNGTAIQTQHPGSATDSYSCSAHSSLVITGSGGTVTSYAPG